ncbi:hypothetical protein [Frigidibacter sp. MR17.24]|uniref:hypothetical protein n=1 Tax=Frigidibacter sp. MR17.24 TaxID=3127345 RepID=UPI0030130541
MTNLDEDLAPTVSSVGATSIAQDRSACDHRAAAFDHHVPSGIRSLAKGGARPRSRAAAEPEFIELALRRDKSRAEDVTPLAGKKELHRFIDIADGVAADRVVGQGQHEGHAPSVRHFGSSSKLGGPAAEAKDCSRTEAETPEIVSRSEKVSRFEDEAADGGSAVSFSEVDHARFELEDEVFALNSPWRHATRMARKIFGRIDDVGRKQPGSRLELDGVARDLTEPLIASLHAKHPLLPPLVAFTNLAQERLARKGICKQGGPLE